MIRTVIDGAFRMRVAGKDEWLPATVLGSVYADLLKNGRIEEPYWRDNELQALELMDQDYEYLGIFNVDGEMLKQEKVYLHFDGLDTLADIYLNGRWIGYVNNMHRTREFEVCLLSQFIHVFLKFI